MLVTTMAITLMMMTAGTPLPAFIDDDCDKLGDDDDIDPKTSIHHSVTKQDDCDNALQCSDNVE